MIDYTAGVERGQRVKSLWNGEQGHIKYTMLLHRTGGDVVILWDSGKTTKEVYKCDIELI